MQFDLSFISCRNVIWPPPEVNAIIDKQNCKKKKNVPTFLTLKFWLLLSVVFPCNPIWFLITPRVTEWEPQMIMRPLLACSLSAILQKKLFYIGSHPAEWPIIMMQYITLALNFSPPVPQNPECCVLWSNSPWRQLIWLMYGIVADEPLWRGKEISQKAEQWHLKKITF